MFIHSWVLILIYYFLNIGCQEKITYYIEEFCNEENKM